MLDQLAKLVERVDYFTEEPYTQEAIIEDMKNPSKDVKEVYLPNVNNIEISIGYSSQEFLILSGLKSMQTALDSRRSRRFLTIKIKNIDVDTHDEAQKRLQIIANSILFQVGSLIDLPIVLKEERENLREKRKEISQRLHEPKPENNKITEIKFEYDIEPMTLYLHAKATINLPLYKFLAFYQAIEFYFPIYSNNEAKIKIKRLLKDPTFDFDLEQNITKLISIIKVNRNNEIGDEKSQLKATISGCIAPEDLFEFINQNENRKNFYEKNQGKCLSQNNISTSPKSTNVISDVAERIYDIRCRIVHKKADENNGSIILPFSREVKLIKYDIELVEFIAKKLLIENSRAFR